ncbi:MAG: ribonuclease PH [Planctomycetes bacterium]|nr:ribonuclease PH [Planctomycetota bacterium]
MIDRRERDPLEIRPVVIRPDFLSTADGSALYEAGGTRILCAVNLVEGLPKWRAGAGKGWATAEYAMLPSSTRPRQEREARRGGPSGRTVEIQRLIGRALRAVLDLEALGDNTLFFDCDVLEADGSTRAASINGAYVALGCAVGSLLRAGRLARNPVRQGLAAVSIGRVAGGVRVDLDYQEDAAADVDGTMVFTADGRLIDVHGGAEGSPFSREDLAAMLDAAWSAACRILAETDGAIRRAHAAGRSR